LAVILLGLLGFAYSNIQQDPDYPAFQAWMQQYEKVYATDVETTTRFTNFQNSKKIVERNNQIAEAQGGAMFGLTKFADLSRHEFKQQVLAKEFLPTAEDQREYLVTPANVAAPESFDWRSKSKVTAIKNQGQCGSCWAFSATENIESVWMIKKDLTNHTMAPLAPQQIVDCDHVDGGCNGGDTPTAYKYVINAGGLETEKEYPYRAVDGSCHFEKSKVYSSITGYKYATTKGDEATLMTHTYNESPLSICVDAENWQFYTSGVMTGRQCARKVTLDHCVQIIGYDHSHNPPYWIVRNSWGADWGEKGLILLEYGQNTCGLTDEATTAVIA
jgi:C1A family cysteine protease